VGELVTIGIDDGHNVPVQVLGVLRMSGVVLHQFANQPGHESRRDPLASVNTFNRSMNDRILCVPFIGPTSINEDGVLARSAGGDLHHQHVTTFVAFSLAGHSHQVRVSGGQFPHEVMDLSKFSENLNHKLTELKVIREIK
jgi:hypothetical protein